MKKLAWRISILITLTALIGGGLVACNSGSSDNTQQNAVQEYADPATETTLQALSEADLEKYVRNGNAAFKAAVTQEILDQVSAQVTSQLGAYQSKTFLRTEEQQGYIIVHYQAKYEKSTIGVRMVFDQDHLVAGQFFE